MSNSPFDAAVICDAARSIQKCVDGFVYPTDIQAALDILDDVFETLYKLQMRLAERPDPTQATLAMQLSLGSQTGQGLLYESKTSDNQRDGLDTDNVEEVADEFFDIYKSLPTVTLKFSRPNYATEQIARAVGAHICSDARGSLQFLSKMIDPTRSIASKARILNFHSDQRQQATTSDPTTSLHQGEASSAMLTSASSGASSHGVLDSPRLSEKPSAPSDTYSIGEKDLPVQDSNPQEGTFQRPLDLQGQTHTRVATMGYGTPIQSGSTSNFATMVDSIASDPPPSRKMTGVKDCEGIIQYAQRHPENATAQRAAETAKVRLVAIHGKRSQKNQQKKELKNQLMQYPVQMRGELREALKNDRKNERALLKGSKGT